MAVATDLGRLLANAKSNFAGLRCSGYRCNHDLKMLRNQTLLVGETRHVGSPPGICESEANKIFCLRL